MQLNAQFVDELLCWPNSLTITLDGWNEQWVNESDANGEWECMVINLFNQRSIVFIVNLVSHNIIQFSEAVDLF